MKVVVLGATGLIGSAVLARLAADDHTVIAVSRRPRPGLARAKHVCFDIARACRPSDWQAVLDGADAVVNCAGTLQDAPGESTQGVHASGIAAMCEACEIAAISRVVHVSAVGIERETTAFARTKLAGDRAVIGRNLDWIILRPAVVVGRPAYGGSALLRGLAGLPILPEIPDAGPLQLVHLDDVVATIVFCLGPEAPKRQILELVGPRPWPFSEIVTLFRTWFEWRPAYRVAIPRWAASILYSLGDVTSTLGWRPPIRSTARHEIVYGAIGDPTAWRTTTGIVGRDIEQALACEPASVQERWFARLYLLKPLIFAVFGLFWVTTGAISLGPGWEIGRDLLHRGGAGEPLASMGVAGGALADIAIGAAILYRPSSRYGLLAALAISLAYAVLGTILVPDLWREPLGPLLKIWPIMALNLVALAILEDR